MKTRKLLAASLLLASLAFGFTSCLKDKGFDNNEYGINDPDTQPRGVGFPLSDKTQARGLEITATTQPLNGLAVVKVLSGVNAPTPITVTFANTTATQVAAYNTENGLTGTEEVLVLPAAVYTVGSSLTIPAGEKIAEIPVNIINTTSLDPLRTYALGLTISGAGAGYRVADNMKNLLVLLSIKNRLDGVYEITGEALRAGDPALTGPFGPYEADLVTNGANSVQWDGRVYWASQLSQLPPGYEPNITVDPVSNLVTSVNSVSGIFMTAPIVRTDIIGTEQRYDPASKTLYFEFTYGGGPTSRLFSIKAKYLHSR